MKKLIVILISFLWINTSLDAQVIYHEEADTSSNKDTEEVIPDSTIAEQTEKTDVIFRHDGTKMFVDVKRINLNDLYYSVPGETKVIRMDQRLVYKIEYKSGKLEILNETAPDVRKVGDYRKVKVTQDPDDVEGLIEVAKVEAKSEGSTKGYSTLKSLERTAIIVLRRKAALVNADIVLITEKYSNVAFGEIPSITLHGVAYAYR